MTEKPLAAHRKIAPYFSGTVPQACQLCGRGLTAVFIDGATDPQGRWGYMDEACHARVGRGLGVGLGQKYEKQADGRWMKTGG